VSGTPTSRVMVGEPSKDEIQLRQDFHPRSIRMPVFGLTIY
jgi:hypothetical protein